ncbi:hypothetical protein CRUP_016960 [Coryphaenoides rupestris]|nr:hypothetical protein CRUP_016960 [Coryphaenoides rupestris]
MPAQSIETAVWWEDVAKTYFFKGDSRRAVRRANLVLKPTELQDLTSFLLLFFTSGKEYWKFNNQRLRVEPGYPRSILKDFMGCDGTSVADPGRPGVGAAGAPAAAGAGGGPRPPHDDGTSDVVIELDNAAGTVQAMAIVVPCVLLLCLLALVYTVVQFKRKGTPRHILYCKRSMQEWV